MSEQVVIDGHWLDLICPWGDLSYTTVWPGGSGTASWSTYKPPSRLLRANLPVKLVVGAQVFWAGISDEPDRDTGAMSATGLWTQGNNWRALTSGGAANRVPDVAIPNAIARGMPWAGLPVGGVWGSLVDVDITGGPVTITQLLQQFCDYSGRRWAVDPNGQPYTAPDNTVPAYHMWPDQNMASDSTDLATVLQGRFLDGSYTYQTTYATDTLAVANGYELEATVDLTNRGAMGYTAATAILQTALDQGRSTPRWTSQITAAYGDITNAGGVPIPLHSVAANQVVRLHGLLDDVNLLRGDTVVDVLIGQTSVNGGVLTMTPIDAPPSTLEGFLAQGSAA